VWHKRGLSARGRRVGSRRRAGMGAIMGWPPESSESLAKQLCGGALSANSPTGLGEKHDHCSRLRARGAAPFAATRDSLFRANGP